MENLLTVISNFWHALESGQVPHLGGWTYVFLAFVVIVEGPIATLLGAAAASTGLLKVQAVFIAAAIGNLTADLLWYSMGYFGKLEWVLRIGKHFGLRQKHLDRVQQGFQDQLPKLLIIAKFTAAFTIPTLITAGLAKLSLKRWLPGYVVAEAGWTGLLMLIGYYVTDAARRMQSSTWSFGIISIIIFVVAILLLFRRWLQKQNTIAE